MLDVCGGNVKSDQNSVRVMSSLSAGDRERYGRQIILEEMGEKGQMDLLHRHVTVIGCGALGGAISDTLARSGIGHITVVDRDLVELSNLHRQVLFDEHDIGYPKATTAADKLGRINSGIRITPMVEDVNPATVEGILRGCDLVMDGTDNMETRYLINDACVKHGIPWIYGGVLGTLGMSMTILPGDGPCLRCIIPAPPFPGALPTCDTAGVLNTIPSAVAAIQCTEAMKLLLGKETDPALIIYDIWAQRFRKVDLKRNNSCECCVSRVFPFLHRAPGGEGRGSITTLCGSRSVQITPSPSRDFPFEKVAGRLERIRPVTRNEYALTFPAGEFRLVLFRSGRAIIHGTADVTVARSIFSRYIGL